MMIIELVLTTVIMVIIMIMAIIVTAGSYEARIPFMAITLNILNIVLISSLTSILRATITAIAIVIMCFLNVTIVVVIIVIVITVDKQTH